MKAERLLASGALVAMEPKPHREGLGVLVLLIVLFVLAWGVMAWLTPL